MVCKSCGTDNDISRKSCYSCYKILEGRTINNMDGKPGYRTKTGGFIYDDQELNYDEITIDGVYKIRNGK